MGPFGFESVLVVDDDIATAGALRKEAEALAIQCLVHVTSYVDGLQCLEDKPALVIVEAGLGGESAHFVEVARALPRTPCVVVVGRRASGVVVAELLRRGATTYVEKPMTASDLRRAVADSQAGAASCTGHDALQQLAAKLVGQMGLKEALQALRAAMHLEALSRTAGSRRAAAALLGVDRRYVQRLVEELGGPPASDALSGQSGNQLRVGDA